MAVDARKKQGDDIAQGDRRELFLWKTFQGNKAAYAEAKAAGAFREVQQADGVYCVNRSYKATTSRSVVTEEQFTGAAPSPDCIIHSIRLNACWDM